MAQNIITIKCGTFNLMNLMLPNVQMYGSMKLSQYDFDRKADWINFMLTQMNADIIGFQECFHLEAIERIISQNKLYKDAEVVMPGENGEQPRVALLSRYPIQDVQLIEFFPKKSLITFQQRGELLTLPFKTFTRPVLKVKVLIPNYGIITFFVVHLKSKRPIFYQGESDTNPIDLARAQVRSLMLRAAESSAVRTILCDYLQGRENPVVVFGDVNDTGNSVTTRIISGEVPQHKLPDDVKRNVWDVLLYHVKDIQARRSYQDFYYTHIHNGMYESLDHIMVSQELVTENPRYTGRVAQVKVFNDHLIDQTFSTEKPDKYKSDHGIVVCSLELDTERAQQFR